MVRELAGAGVCMGPGRPLEAAPPPPWARGPSVRATGERSRGSGWRGYPGGAGLAALECPVGRGPLCALPGRGSETTRGPRPGPPESGPVALPTHPELFKNIWPGAAGGHLEFLGLSFRLVVM